MKRKETKAKGAKGFILFNYFNKEESCFFRVYKKRNGKPLGGSVSFVDYKISNYDFDVKVLDRQAVFRKGTLDLAGKIYGRKNLASDKTAFEKILTAHLNDDTPWLRLRSSKKRHDWTDFVLTHPDLYVEIVDDDAAFFTSKGEAWLDYTTKSMQPAVIYENGRLVWAAEGVKASKTLEG